MAKCGACGIPLYHINEACPNCLPGMAERPPTNSVGGMMNRNSMKLVDLSLLDKLQDLIGKAKTAYMDDISPNRWEGVVPVLEEAFNIILDLRS